jgi:hypothetical protein
MKKKVKLIRQGDLLFIPSKLPEWIEESELREHKRKGAVLAEGEATGHAHKLADPKTAEIFDLGGQGMYLRVGENGVSIVHEEHGPVTLEPKTTYEVHRAREFDYLAQVSRQVRD